GNNTFSGSISGTGASLIKIGSGTQILINNGTSTNTYTGTTTISSGILQIGNGGTTGTLGTGGDVIDNASLALKRSRFTLSNKISGTGTVTQAGPGTTTLSGANTYSGNTFINSGFLAAGVAEVAATSGPFGEGGQIVFGGGTLQQSAINQTDYSARFSQA